MFQLSCRLAKWCVARLNLVLEKEPPFSKFNTVYFYKILILKIYVVNVFLFIYTKIFWMRIIKLYCWRLKGSLIRINEKAE